MFVTPEKDWCAKTREVGEESKVFPHNFRHLFAKSFYLYSIEKNLAHLADVLGTFVYRDYGFMLQEASNNMKIMDRMKIGRKIQNHRITILVVPQFVVSFYYLLFTNGTIPYIICIL